MLSLKTNGLDKHAKGMSLHLGYFDTASYMDGDGRLLAEPFREEKDNGEDDHDGQGPWIVEIGERRARRDAGEAGGEKRLGSVGDEALHDA